MALEIKDLGVKFYASKTKAEALALATLPGDAAEPGAICFVSDNTGNYIIVDGRIFGDGASGGGGGSGSGDVYSVNGKTGAVVLELVDFPVVVNQSGTVLKTLADYFSADGSVITESLIIQDSNGNDVINISSNGIQIGNTYVATESYVASQISTNNSFILSEAQNKADAAEDRAKAYADTLIASVYKVKGSVQSMNALNAVSNPSVGDVYNVQSTGMNYVYTEDGWDSLGGSIDLSNYKTRDETDRDIADALVEAKNYTDSSLQQINQDVQMNTTAISNISTQVSRNTSNITTNTTNITQNTTNISNLANQLTWQ